MSKIGILNLQGCKLNSVYRIINSLELNNENIFEGLIDDKLIIELKLFFNKIHTTLEIIKCDGDILKEDRIQPIRGLTTIFTEENNKYILYIIKALNDFLPEELKLYGYKNHYDQREIALIHFNKLIDKLTIKKSTIIKYENTDVNRLYNLPIKPKDLKLIIRDTPSIYVSPSEQKYLPPDINLDSKYKDYSRMALINNIIIEYTDFDDETKILKYNKEDINEYFKNKYLKYKIKYYNLYKTLSIIKK